MVNKKLKNLDFDSSKIKNLRLKAFDLPPPIGADAIFSKPKTRVIAEVKKRSPSEGVLKLVDAVSQARLYEEAGAVAISVLTEADHFYGSISDLENVKKSVSLPVLRKDFIVSVGEVYESRIKGADGILLIVGALPKERLKELYDVSLELGMWVLLEIFEEEDLELALELRPSILGINHRNLRTLEIDLTKCFRLCPIAKSSGVRWVVAESAIKTRAQVLELEDIGVDAFLVGSSLMKSSDPAFSLRELCGRV
ncbi:MAG: indole-3-glycerol phosphate synthase TrpC [Aquificaceae bacterium]|nr:indole-3-glycerol phosphate synthase TrpC [Aquificaceae bacterium]